MKVPLLTRPQSMKLHYYGRLDTLESCFTYQTFEVEGVTLLLQNAPRFGYEPATMTIKNPALFVKKDDGYYRFVIEDFKVEVKDGVLTIEDEQLKEIAKEAIGLI